MLGLLESKGCNCSTIGTAVASSNALVSIDSVTMDLVTHLPATNCGHDTIYIVVDIPSKFMYFIPCKHTVSAADLAYLFLANVFAHHGMSALIVLDHDPWFTSFFWYSLITALGYKHSLPHAFHPEQMV